MGEMMNEGQNLGGNIDLSQFYEIFFEEAGENLDQMEQMLLQLDLAPTLTALRSASLQQRAWLLVGLYGGAFSRAPWISWGLLLVFIGLSILPLAMTVMLYGLEFLVAFLQAYVFAILTCIYLNDAL